MNKINPIKFITVSLFSMVMLLTSCNDFDKLNQNPDAVNSQSVNPGNQLTYIQASLSGSRYEQWRTNAIYTMGFSQSITGSWSFSHGGYYIKNDSYMDGLWRAEYPREIKECVDIIGNTEGDESKTNINAIARIMKVFIFHRLTDLWGDIPYFDAGQAYYKGIYAARYDKQEDIYNDFFQELDLATNTLSADKDVITGDLFFDGDIIQWQKFANSLRLRLALRVWKADPELAKSEAQKAVAATGGVMTSISDDVVLKHAEVSFHHGSYLDLRGNGLSQVFNVGSESAYLTAPMVNYMEAINDPKLLMLGRVYSKQILRYGDISKLVDLTGEALAIDSIMGMKMGPSYDFSLNPFVLTKDGESYEMTNINAPLQLAEEFRRLEAPYTHFTYAEVEFLIAEAITRGYLSGNADEHFKNGLQASIDRLISIYECESPSETAISDFVSGYTLSADNETALEQINSQLWVNNLLNGPESFANWRRSGYPKLKFIQNTANESTIIPRRLIYPIEEQSVNHANWEEAVKRFPNGIDSWENRVWWDKE